MPQISTSPQSHSPSPFFFFTNTMVSAAFDYRGSQQTGAATDVREFWMPVHNHLLFGRELEASVDEEPQVYVVYVTGFRSQIPCLKSQCGLNFARFQGLGFFEFDQYCQGRSSGEVVEESYTTWIADFKSIIEENLKRKRILILCASMGLGVTLATLQRLSPDDASRVIGVVAVGGSVDFMRRVSREVQGPLKPGGVYQRPSQYSQSGYYDIHHSLIIDGAKYREEMFTPKCPVVWLHGVEDRDAPITSAREGLRRVQGPFVKLVEVLKGDHRLSDAHGLTLIEASLRSLLEWDSEGRKLTRFESLVKVLQQAAEE